MIRLLIPLAVLTAAFWGAIYVATTKRVQKYSWTATKQFMVSISCAAVVIGLVSLAFYLLGALNAN